MTTFDTRGKLVTSIMTLELQESPDYIQFWCIHRGQSRISGKGVHMYDKGRGFAFLILSHFS